MTGLEAFLKVFGELTVLDAIVFLLAVGFLVAIFLKARKYLKDKQEAEIKKRKAEEARDKEIKEALEGVRKYPEYRQQSIDIQHKLEDENKAVRGDIVALRKDLKATNKRLQKMEEDTKRRERNKVRDRLLQYYRHYTNPELNPSQSWTSMEAGAFWEMFRDYEKDGGDGDIHTVVQPAMEKLLVIEIGDK